MYDRYSDVYRYVPLNGDLAGLSARTDLIADAWYSPAGLNRGIIRGAVKLAFNPNKTQRDDLYRARVSQVKELFYSVTKLDYQHHRRLTELMSEDFSLH